LKHLKWGGELRVVALMQFGQGRAAHADPLLSATVWADKLDYKEIARPGLDLAELHDLSIGTLGQRSV